MGADFFDTAERALNQEEGGHTAWANFGYWPHAQSYPQAARALACLLADSCDLQAGHRLLDMGFGMGEQLQLWQQQYGVRDGVGLNPSASQCAVAHEILPQSSSLQRHCAGVEDLPRLLPGQSFDRMLALDCAYHFPRRESLLRLLRQHIDAHGRLAWTDVYLPAGTSSTHQRLLRAALCHISRIPVSNLQSLVSIQAGLQRAGWQLEQQRDITEQVWPPFARWWSRYRRQHTVPPRARLKFDLSAAVVARAAKNGLLRYGLFVAQPIAGASQYPDAFNRGLIVA